MTPSKCLVEGGIPSDWTPLNLVWLATTHRRLGEDKTAATVRPDRAHWHRRWAVLIEDLLETYRVHHH